jgi:hypothetical protein
MMLLGLPPRSIRRRRPHRHRGAVLAALNTAARRLPAVA